MHLIRAQQVVTICAAKNEWVGAQERRRRSVRESPLGIASRIQHPNKLPCSPPPFQDRRYATATWSHLIGTTPSVDRFQTPPLRV